VSILDIGGTAISGAVVAFFGVPVIVILNGVSNLYAAASEFFIHMPKTVQQGEPVTVKGILHDSGSAIKTIVHDKFLQLFIPCALVLNLLSSGCGAMFLPFCLESGYSVEFYGIMMTVLSVSNLAAVALLGVLKLSPMKRYLFMAVGFCASTPLYVVAYLIGSFVPMCCFLFVGSFLNCIANALFNAAIMLALPEENRGAILGFIRSGSVGGTALSTVIYGFLGDVFPLKYVFAVGFSMSILPMILLCTNPRSKKFMLEH